MDTAVLTALVAVGGTVAGSLATSVPTYLISRRAERASRSERARTERLSACVEMTAALDTMQRSASQVGMGRGQHSQEYEEALKDAWFALSRLRLVVPSGPAGRLPSSAEMAIRASVSAAQLADNATAKYLATQNEAIAAIRQWVSEASNYLESQR